MDLNHDFTVDVPVEEAWRILTDVERIAPCLPGAQLQEIEGDVYRGVVKVKVGPIQAQFKGQASFVERDDTAHRVVLKGEGRDTGGKGNASATITAQLTPVDATSTTCNLVTDLSITGKVAQFGRGALADVSEKLLAQFSDNLNELIKTEGAAPAPQRDLRRTHESIAVLLQHGEAGRADCRCRRHRRRSLPASSAGCWWSLPRWR